MSYTYLYDSMLAVIAAGVLIDLFAFVTVLGLVTNITIKTLMSTLGWIITLAVLVIAILWIKYDGPKDPWFTVLGLYTIVHVVAFGLVRTYYNHRYPEAVVQEEMELSFPRPGEYAR